MKIKPLQWSAEQPHLYTVVLTLRDERGMVILAYVVLKPGQPADAAQVKAAFDGRDFRTVVDATAGGGADDEFYPTAMPSAMSGLSGNICCRRGSMWVSTRDTKNEATEAIESTGSPALARISSPWM